MPQNSPIKSFNNGYRYDTFPCNEITCTYVQTCENACALHSPNDTSHSNLKTSNIHLHWREFIVWGWELEVHHTSRNSCLSLTSRYSPHDYHDTSDAQRFIGKTDLDFHESAVHPADFGGHASVTGQRNCPSPGTTNNQHSRQSANRRPKKLSDRIFSNHHFNGRSKIDFSHHTEEGDRLHA